LSQTEKTVYSGANHLREKKYMDGGNLRLNTAETGARKNILCMANVMEDMGKGGYLNGAGGSSVGKPVKKRVGTETVKAEKKNWYRGGKGPQGVLGTGEKSSREARVLRAPERGKEKKRRSGQVKRP